MRSRTWLLASVLIACLRSSIAHAVPAFELEQRAKVAAARDDWNTAARALEELLAAGIDSSDVIYDLGTAYAHAGRFGEAIWRFEQVTLRSPFAFDALQNLRATRLRLAHRDAARTGRAVVESASPFAVWLSELLTLDWAVFLTLLFQLATAACAYAWRRRRGGELSRVAGAVGAILFASAVCSTGAIVVARAAVRPGAVVLHDGVRLLRSPTGDAIAELPVREGERIELLGRDGLFARVRTFGGVQGWLATRDVGPLAP